MAQESKYSDELADTICALLGSGLSLNRITKSDDMPSMVTVYNWITKYPEFREKYMRAREDQADTLADEICDIADEGLNDYSLDENGKRVVNHDHIARSRLRVDARKWVASKLKPKKYGDKITAETQNLDKNGNPTDPPTTADAELIRRALEKLGEKK